MKFLVLLAVSLTYPVQTAQPCQGACMLVAQTLEKQLSLPQDLLVSVLMAESTPRGWPWTLNVKGKSYYFKTKQEAVEMVRSLQRRGVKNIDVGCMQINLRYHGHAFKTIEDSLDPHRNISYGASFLKILKKRYSSWSRAVAHYHSAQPQAQRPYLQRVMEYWKKMRRLRVAL